MISPETLDVLKLLGGMASLLGMFAGLLFWGVKYQVSSLKDDHQKTSLTLQDHLDKKLDQVNAEIKAQAIQISDHEKQLHERQLDQLRLRNEVLESMRNQYVRHDDIVDMKKQIESIFLRIDKMIFRGDRDQ